MCTTMFVEYANESLGAWPCTLLRHVEALPLALRYIRIYSDSIARHDMGDALDIQQRCNQKACFSNSLLDYNPGGVSVVPMQMENTQSIMTSQMAVGTNLRSLFKSQFPRVCSV